LYAAGNTFAFLARSNPSAGEGGAGSFVEGSFFLVHQTNGMNLSYRFGNKHFLNTEGSNRA